MKLVSRASRPGIIVGVLRILCNGPCTAQRFHTEDYEHTCCAGCPNEPDSLSHYNECPRLYDMLRSFWGQATMLPRRNHLLHDLITQVVLRSLQYGIVVMDFIDAFVYAHHHHRRNIENPGNFGDCIKRENPLFCLLSLLPTPMRTRQHASQDICLQSRAKTSVCRSPKPDTRTFTLVPQHVKEVMISRDGPFIQTGVLDLWMVKP